MGSHGGKRSGAGRPKGEKTQVIRVPVSRVSALKEWLQSDDSQYRIPLYASSVRAGFPSPADDYIEDVLDLNAHLIQNPSATFVVRVAGDSMRNIGIIAGNLLLVDRSIEPCHGKIVIAAIDGELTVKRLCIDEQGVSLVPENPDYPVIAITESLDMVIWGVVTNMIQEF